MRQPLITFLLLGWMMVSGNAAVTGHLLEVQIAPQFHAQPLAYDTITNTLASGHKISVTRLDFLLSKIALRSADGKWIELPNWYAYISGREGKTHFTLSGVPEQKYDRIRFQVGLDPQINHKNPAEFPANHPLNPEVNGLHWGWMGGYVFLAIEGHWSDGTGTTPSGYSYHVATDDQLMRVELPIRLDLSADTHLMVALNVDRIFERPNAISLTTNSSSTHSRTNDAVAAQLRVNIESAFEAQSSAALNSTNHPVENAIKVEKADSARLYRFTYSRFFPQPELPKDNPLTEEGVALGRKLFFETRLSVNNSQACATCHVPAKAFTDRRMVSLGAEGQTGTRNAMPLFNLAWKSSFFWDGRAPTLRRQVLQPIQNPIEMHETLENVTARLTQDATYRTAFANAFGSEAITSDRVARALEQYLLTLVSFDSKFDRVLKGEAKFTAEEQRGFVLFHTEYDPRIGQFGADCFHCHGGPLFQSQGFANNGLDKVFKDAGRIQTTGKEGDRGKFAVPSLRNVELTGPYMHDGRFKTLEEVVEHYSTGMKRSATLDPNLAKRPDGGVPLSEADKKALVAFMKTLTDESLRASQQTNLAVSINTQPRKSP